MQRARWFAVATMAVAVVACSEDDDDGETNPPMKDAGVARDAGEEPVDPPDGGARIRTLVEYELLPGAEDDNQLNAPDFESKLISAGWPAVDQNPMATAPPPIQRQIFIDTPSDRREVVRIPGTETHPATVAIYGMGWLTGVGFNASVWLGFDASLGDAPFRGDEVTFFVFEADAGAVAVDLEEHPETAVTIDDVRWVRFSVLASGRYVGRAMVGIQNYGPRPMWVNGPALRSATPIAPGRTPRAIRGDERAQLSRLRTLDDTWRRTTDLDRIGLPEGVR